MSAHAQDEDDEEEEEEQEQEEGKEGEGEFGADRAGTTRLIDKPFPAYTSAMTRPPSSGVKLDQLPAYCDPPNPCPIGYDPDSLATPCDRNIPNTKEFNRAWILRKMHNGECPCDEEHMESYVSMTNEVHCDIYTFVVLEHMGTKRTNICIDGN
ncbi:unnamed protein product [Dibothriocephalus latus]|uniref:Neuroendocrine protein 7B2 n=1 Tax=Dibothriocephalus latus TaxID=60516 RepID=A0A3P7MPL7_DIBLA|nr:unnamed protein product [Dibothriocephalus latus]